MNDREALELLVAARGSLPGLDMSFWVGDGGRYPEGPLLRPTFEHGSQVKAAGLLYSLPSGASGLPGALGRGHCVPKLSCRCYKQRYLCTPTTNGSSASLSI